MQPRRLTKEIEGWAQYEGHVGFRMIFTDGTSELFLFDLTTALELCTQGKTLLESVQQVQQQAVIALRAFEQHEREKSAAHLPRSGVGVGDAVKLRLIKSGD